MPCGYDAPQGPRGGDRLTEPSSRGCGRGASIAVDAAAYFSRPGPRLIDGLELLAHILHPQRVPSPPPGAQALELELTVRG